MSTWHQDKGLRENPYQFDDPLRWTVLTDPPSAMRSLSRFPDRASAEEYLSNLERNNPKAFEYSKILQPSGDNIFCNSSED